MNKLIVISTMGILLSSCASNAIKTTGSPEKAITLEQAFESVGKSLRALDDATGDKMFGIAASEIEVTFNISNTAIDNKGVNISIPGSAKVESIGQSTYKNSGGEASGLSNAILNNNSLSAHSSIKGTRANQVTVKFESILKLIKDMSIEKIRLLREMGYFDRASTAKSQILMFDGNKMVIKPSIKKDQE